MNKVLLSGRLTADPEIRSTQDGMAVGTYTLAVDRPFARQEQKTDFIRCQVWEKKAEFAEKYLRKGIKLIVTGRIQTGSYTNRDGQKVYTTDVVVEDQEFAESKKQEETQQTAKPVPADGFVPVPDTADLPFN